ncbi:MAG: hypothetical protein AB7U73_06605 [Pirellulales bacterium]
MSSPEANPAAANLEEGHEPSAQLPTREHLRALPPEVGAVLILFGLAGLVFPGPVGTPILIAGGIAIWPGAFGKLDRWFEQRFPRAHQAGMQHVDRFLKDFEKRYPPGESR